MQRQPAAGGAPAVALARPGADGHHETVSREALGDAPPDALDDERARSDDAPAAVLATISVDRPEPPEPPEPLEPPPTRRLALRQPPARRDEDHPADGARDGDGPPGPDDGIPAGPPAARATPADGDLDLDLSDADPPPGTPGGRTAAAPGQRWSRPVTAAAVVGLLVVGALAGATSARQQGQADLDAAARVVVAAHVDGQFGAEGTTGDQAGDVVQLVDVSLVGTIGGSDTVTVTRLRTPVGDFDVYAPVTATDGEPGRSTLLKGRVDCTRANALKNADTLTGRVLVGSTAVVRPEGSSRDVEVPVLVPASDAPLFSFDQRCNPQTYASPYDGPSYSVGALVAHSDGSLDFVASTGSARPLRTGPSRLAVVTFDASGSGAYTELLPTSVDGDTATYAIPDTRWTVRTTPALPLVIDEPTLVRVRYEYACRRVRLSRPPALPSLPDVRLGTAAASGTVNPFLDGWDDGAMASAMTAAAVLACGTEVSATSPAPGSVRRPGPRQQ